jgi:hypothetical protein
MCPETSLTDTERAAAVDALLADRPSNDAVEWLRALLTNGDRAGADLARGQDQFRSSEVG